MSSFRIHAALDAFEKAGDEHPMRIGGIVSTDELDKQGEKIVQKGLDFSPFLAEGWFNDNHGQRTQDVVGYPTSATFVRKGEALPNGKKAPTNGWWAEGYLLNTDEGRKIWGLTQALAKSPRKLGFSIEGKVQQRSKANTSLITAAIVKNVAVTHCPVNTGTEMNVLAKALTAGAAVGSAAIGTGPGDGGALRGESLEGSTTNVAGPKTEHLTESADGGEPDNGGWGGTTMHKGDEGLSGMTEAQWLMHALPAVKPKPVRLTKAEASIIIRERFPGIPESDVDRIIANASGGS